MTRNTYIFWAVFVAAALLRITASFYRTPPDAVSCLHAVSHGTGTIAEDPSTNAKGQVFVVAAEHVFVGAPGDQDAAQNRECAADINIHMTTGFYPRYMYGQRIAF